MDHEKLDRMERAGAAQVLKWVKDGYWVKGAPKPTDAEREAQLAKCRELRKMYHSADVNIHHHKLPFGQSDEEIDFNFQVVKALGCSGITTERSEELAKKLGPFANKHNLWVAFHNHTNYYPLRGPV